jgi:hypothetical protein
MPDKWSDRTPLQRIYTVVINAMGILALLGIALQILFPVEPFVVHETYDHQSKTMALSHDREGTVDCRLYVDRSVVAERQISSTEAWVFSYEALSQIPEFICHDSEAPVIARYSERDASFIILRNHSEQIQECDLMIADQPDQRIKLRPEMEKEFWVQDLQWSYSCFDSWPF